MKTPTLLRAVVVTDPSGCTPVKIIDTKNEVSPVCSKLVDGPDGTRSISEPKKKTAKDFLFHVSKADDQVFATITSKEYWEKHHHADDSDDDALLLEEYGIYLLQESDYEPKTPMTVQEFHSFLLAAGFEENTEFTAFLENIAAKQQR